MKSEHDRFQLLAAAAVDGRLTADEQDELRTHIATCAECRAFQAALRRDNACLVDMLAPIAVPAELRATVAEAERTGRPRPQQLRQGRTRVMPSLVGVLLAIVVVTLTAGAGVWLASRPLPSPGSRAVVPATGMPSSHPTSSPSAGPSAATPLGGGPLLVYGFNEGKDETTLSLVDVAAGDRTTLGTLPYKSFLEHTQLQWSADHTALLITRHVGRLEIPQLEDPTETATTIHLVCCLPDGYWTLSPQGEMVAGVQENESSTGAIRIVPLDGSAARTASELPVDIVNLAPTITWAPDGSALALPGCGPCQPLLPRKPPIERHGKLFVVPVDGSPVRELLDLTDAFVGSPAWSPDGTRIAVIVARCVAGTVAHECSDVATVIATVDVVGGTVTDIAPVSSESGPPVWSPDSARLAFVDGAKLFVVRAAGGSVVEIATVPQVRSASWSPDGRWLLYDGETDVFDVRQLWIVSAEGGDARLLGTARAWTW